MYDIRKEVVKILEKLLDNADTDQSNAERHKAWSEACQAMRRLKADIEDDEKEHKNDEN